MLEETNIFCIIVNDCSGSLRSPGGGEAAHLNDMWFVYNMFSIFSLNIRFLINTG